MRKPTVVSLGLCSSAALFSFFVPRVVVINQTGTAITPIVNPASTSVVAVLPLPSVPESPPPVSPAPVTPSPNVKDLPPQAQLPNPPDIVKGVYLTAWSAGSPTKVASIIRLIKRTELNAVVFDIKDYSGYLSYLADVPEAKKIGAESEIRIVRPNALIKQFHDNGIYVIGRITNFQDPILAQAHPEWAMHDKTTGAVWTDNKGLAWMDPAAKPVWDYLAAIAKDGFDRGFDEMNFDYVRFASDGSLGNISYPYWDQKTPRTKVIASYFKFLRATFPDKKLSADLFGLATINHDDLGIGQMIEPAYGSFDAVAPMVYPSHYAPGFLGYKAPAKHPYEVIRYSMDSARARLDAYAQLHAGTSTATSTLPTAEPAIGVRLRPWIQDFNLGATYNAAMVRKEIQAVYDSLKNGSSSAAYGGWLLWNPSNVYTEAALEKE